LQSLQTIADKRYRITVLHRDSIELPVVNAKKERVVLFAYEHYVARPRARCRFDNAMYLHFVNLLVNNVQILEWVSPESVSERAVSCCINAILNIRCPTNVVLSF